MCPMADEELLRTLHEIRDLQKTHVELYKQALSNQTSALRRQKIIGNFALIVVVGMLLVLLLTVFRH